MSLHQPSSDIGKAPVVNVRWKSTLSIENPISGGTTHVIFEPWDFIAKFASLVPKPRVNLARFHGVFAPNGGNPSQVGQGQQTHGN